MTVNHDCDDSDASFDAAKRVLCCIHKEADIPEVEAVIKLVLPSVDFYWKRIAMESVRDIEAQLDSFDAALAAAEPGEKDELLRDLILALLASLRRRLQAPISPAGTALVRRSASSLMLDGAKALALPLDLALAPRLLPAAEADLLTLIRGRVELREQEIRAALRGLISQAELLGAPVARDVWRQRLLRELGVETGSWLPFVVDQWAYRWFNIGGVVAARQGGVLALVAVAILDAKTSNFCRWVNGRVISMERAQRQIDRHVSAALAGDVRAIMANWPLLTFEPTDGPAEFELKFATVGLPPYHGHCRTRTKLLRLRD